MGLASSQARLLSITARLTSNEYESQQISNAKMRLATQSQEASEAYIAALNDTEYSYISFDSTGTALRNPLTVSTMYEYADGKNQYILTNSAGKVLLSNKDIQNYENSPNLESFLDKYGIKREFKTVTLENAWNNVHTNLTQNALDWEYAVENYGYSQSSWAADKVNAQTEYLTALGEYKNIIKLQEDGEDVSNFEISVKQNKMETQLQDFTKLVSYKTAKESKIVDMALAAIKKGEMGASITVNKDGGTKSVVELYNGYQAYKSALAQYQDELDRLGISARGAYQYDDPTKAQWYTNLWYRLNGPSTDNSGAKNYATFNISDGIREAKDGQKILPDDTSLLNSSVWISNALSKGLVNIEQAAFSNDEMTLADQENPFSYNLYGITWSGKIYSSISDIVESDNDKKVAQAEAEYQRKTAEINAKDEKYQRKISLLDSEHNAIQTEYESVKNAMNKNIDRSFKAFQG